MNTVKSFIIKFVKSEGFLYLFFGGLTTVVYMITRFILGAIHLVPNAGIEAAIANIVGILFAFATNDTFVFHQESHGRLQRFGKFVLARLATLLLDIALAYLLVTQYPNIIGRFVHHNLQAVNAIESLFSQVLIIVLNYIFSKLFIFKNTKKSDSD